MNPVMPYQTLGIIGGGQLGRMMCLSAKAMGYRVAVLDPTPNCPCGQVADIEITAAYNDLSAIKELAEISDVITYEFENIDYDALVWLEQNANLPQRSDVLKITQHRFSEKEAIKNMGIPVAKSLLIRDRTELDTHFYFPSVLKTTRGGYDGKGQVVIRSEADRAAAKALADSAECILEAFMPYNMEISVMIARSITGEQSVLPIAENIHVNNILHQTIVPARITPALAQKATDYAKKISAELNAIGILAIEMFVVGDEIYVNELAPRPHNSGHYSMDACVTGQFEQHVRAICGLPLGDTTLLSPVVMVNILGNHLDKDNLSNLAAYLPLIKTGKLHLYGKAQAVDKRKMGHVNILGSDIDQLLTTIDSTRIWQTEDN